MDQGQGVRTVERTVAGNESVLQERMRRGEERLKELKLEVSTAVRAYVRCHRLSYELIAFCFK